MKITEIKRYKEMIDYYKLANLIQQLAEAQKDNDKRRVEQLKRKIRLYNIDII